MRSTTTTTMLNRPSPSSMALLLREGRRRSSKVYCFSLNTLVLTVVIMMLWKVGGGSGSAAASLVGTGGAKLVTEIEADETEGPTKSIVTSGPTKVPTVAPTHSIVISEPVTVISAPNVAIEDLILYDTSTNPAVPIESLLDGTIVDLSTTGMSLTILANVSVTENVYCNFTFDDYYTQREFRAPFVLSGNDGMYFNSFLPLLIVGTHRISASIYDYSDVLLDTISIDLEVVDTSSSFGPLVGFNLVNTVSSAQIPLPEIVDLNSVGTSLSIVAIAEESYNETTIDYVTFWLDDTFVRRETNPPYSLGGNYMGTYRAVSSLNVPGDHVVVAIAVDTNDEIVGSITSKFTVTSVPTSSTSVPTSSPVSTDIPTPYPSDETMSSVPSDVPSDILSDPPSSTHGILTKEPSSVDVILTEAPTYLSSIEPTYLSSVVPSVSKNTQTVIPTSVPAMVTSVIPTLIEDTLSPVTKQPTKKIPFILTIEPTSAPTPLITTEPPVTVTTKAPIKAPTTKAPIFSTFVNPPTKKDVIGNRPPTSAPFLSRITKAPTSAAVITSTPVSSRSDNRLINGLVLYDTSSDPAVSIGSIVNGSIYDLADIGMDLTILADATFSEAHLKFTFDNFYIRREFNSPYVLAGNDESYFNTFEPLASVGNHSVVASVYDFEDMLLDTVTVDFTIIDTSDRLGPFINFNLMDTTTTREIPLPEIVDLRVVGTSLSIIAITENVTIDYVTMFFDNSFVRQENKRPWTLGGNHKGRYKPVSLLNEPGIHTILAIAFDGDNEFMGSLSATFTVIGGTFSPTVVPTPTDMPSFVPTEVGITKEPTFAPSDMPSTSPSDVIKSSEPTFDLSAVPSAAPIEVIASSEPTFDLSAAPSASPIEVIVSSEPTVDISAVPSAVPIALSEIPSSVPTEISITSEPTFDPTVAPIVQPSDSPSLTPTELTTLEPTFDPTVLPTPFSSDEPSLVPSPDMTRFKSDEPSKSPTYDQVSAEPTFISSVVPTLGTSSEPSTTPVEVPSTKPSIDTKIPTSVPVEIVSDEPTFIFSSEPTILSVVPTPFRETDEPTVTPITKVPTKTPTTSPLSKGPSKEPTAIPSTSLPTKSPVSIAPTKMPAKIAPTKAPVSGIAPLLEDNTNILNVTGRDAARPSWKDSYSVGDSCYCATTCDHEICDVVVDTPFGVLTVGEVCDILGTGPGIEGRPIYNDIQCGNGPANNAGDEDDCPGRVDYGPEGCGYIGPKWNFNPFLSSLSPAPSALPSTTPDVQAPTIAPLSTAPTKTPTNKVTTQSPVQSSIATITGELKKWHKITLSFPGPFSSEIAQVNPFMNYRMDVTFTHDETLRQYVVPGYFAADGEAAETSAFSGNQWVCHFAPDEVGLWNYDVLFVTGTDVAVNGGGTPTSFNGDAGTFVVAASDKTGRDHRGKGRLMYVGEHHLQFAEGEWFLKVGADSPENFFAYDDFDGTPDSRGFRKSWSPHIIDFNEGDPTWQEGKGKGIIGAINYLSGEGMNVFSFLTMNIEGDDKNVFPYISDQPEDRLRMDVSKLAQWEIVLEHADKMGMYLHFKMGERENVNLLDGGELGVERKLYYRELIARFGHHLALNWNLSEEIENTNDQIRAFADYVKEIDPYNHIVLFHTGSFSSLYSDFVGYPSIDGASLQNRPDRVFEATLRWVSESAEAGKKWVVANDEENPAMDGVLPDSDDPEHDDIRENVLWGNIMAGGAGVEYYFGYAFPNSDLTCEDFRSRANMWTQSRYALEFFRDNDVKFWEMSNDNARLPDDSEDFVLSNNIDGTVVVYRRSDNSLVDLNGFSGRYNVQWFNPRLGGPLQVGSVPLVIGGFATPVDFGVPPVADGRDWVVLLTPV